MLPQNFKRVPTPEQEAEKYSLNPPDDVFMRKDEECHWSKIVQTTVQGFERGFERREVIKATAIIREA